MDALWFGLYGHLAGFGGRNVRAGVADMLRRFISAGIGLSMIATVTVVGVGPPALVSAAAIISDDFTSGSLAAWTDITRATIDNATGSPAAPSLNLAASAQSAFAALNLATP